MGDSEEKQDVQQPQQARERELPLDTRLLSEAIIELNISRKNVGIYPPGHIQITRSIDRTYDIFLKLFEVRPEMTLGVAKDTLLVGQDYLDRKNPVYRDLALSMNQQGIGAVTFMKDMEKEELVRFHRILTARPDDIRANGGIEKVIADAAIRHIRVVALDFSSFHMTEEQEIVRPQTMKEEGSGADFWQDFITHLSAGSLAAPGEGVALNESERVDPAELARLLNERKLDPNAAIESYDRIISSYVRGSAEKKQLTHEQSKTLARMNDLLRSLNPELRKQFLSVAFDRIATHKTGPVADQESVIGGMTDDLVVEMLEEANAEGREISPTLASLVSKLGRTRPVAEGRQADRRTGPAAPVVLPDNLQALFEREKYEEYVTDDYRKMLRQLSDEPSTDAEPFPLEEHIKSLEDEHLDFQIGRALIAFMEENMDEEDYREFANKLVTVMPQFLESGNFEMLWDIFETLRRHAAEKPVKGIRDIAEETRKFFTDPEFITKALEAFDRWMREKGQAAAGLLQAMGPDTVPGLLEIYSRDEAVGGRRVLFNLLCLFGDTAIREAQKRLRDPRAYYVRNLLLLIRRAGTASAAGSVRPLLQHRDQAVRLEALSTLLKFKDAGAVNSLREALHASDPDFASHAVTLAGQYRITDVTGDVLSKIKRAVLFETDYAENEEILRALGNIGDPRAVPELEKLARASWTLYPRSLMRMKETIYESLGRYPRESISGLLKIGEGMNSDKVRRICGQYQARR
jgi:HEAT repeats/PBS lyase HEAT-like repeat